MFVHPLSGRELRDVPKSDRADYLIGKENEADSAAHLRCQSPKKTRAAWKCLVVMTNAHAGGPMSGIASTQFIRRCEWVLLHPAKNVLSEPFTKSRLT